MDLWLISIALFAIASTASSINTLTTIIRLRCPGMTWERLPLTVWGWFTAALLSIIAFSVLLAAILLLLCDRHAGTSFFLPTGDLVNGSSTAVATAALSSGSISSGSSDTPRSTSPSSPAWASPPCSSRTLATAKSSPTAP